jgi:hypothetical protein
VKALTLTQPWATLVAIGAKRIETRSWRTDYRGPLAIHAAAGFGPRGGKRGYKRLCFTEPFLSVLSLARPNRSDVFYLVDYFMSLPMGAIVAVCELVGIIKTQSFEDCATQYYGYPERGWTLTDQERAFGDYSPGRYAWLLSDVRALSESIPAKGALSLWEWDEKA